jgi:branched-chain amino acid transport system ATP-binding protein
MLKVQNLRTSYGDLQVLRNVSLHVDPGEIVVLIGANGAGKSTLLNTIAGLLHPRAGKILFLGREIQSLRANRIVSQGISLVPEGRQLFAPMTVLDNLILGAYSVRKSSRRFDAVRDHEGAAESSDGGTPGGDESQEKKQGHGGRKEALNAQLREIYELFPILYERRSQAAGTLSGGEQQMLAVGRALMSRPKLLLLDEPSMGLAPIIAREIFASIKRLRDAGTTILLVEQNARAALSVANRGYIMEVGMIVAEGPSEELLASKEIVRAYLGKDYKEVWE